MKSPDAISGIAPMNMACVARALCLSRALVTASDLTRARSLDACAPARLALPRME